MNETGKEFLDRLIELVRDDKPLHDAAVRMANAAAEGMELKNLKLKRQVCVTVCEFRQPPKPSINNEQPKA